LTRFVVDASVATLWYANEAHSAAASVLLDGEDELLVPDLIFVETANALWKKQMRGEFGAEIVEQSLVNLVGLDLVVTPAKVLLQSAAQLASTSRHPIYDCVYVVLARQKNAVLASVDKRLSRLAALEDIKVWNPDQT
jgi:predicted nucleic acid-binding protein